MAGIRIETRGGYGPAPRNAVRIAVTRDEFLALQKMAQPADYMDFAIILGPERALQVLSAAHCDREILAVIE